MVRRSAELLVAVVALSVTGTNAGAQQSAAPMACAARPVGSSTPFDTARVAELIGNFDLVMFDTTSLRGSTRHGGKLALWLQDSIPKKRATMARRVRHQFLVGSFEVAPPDSGDPWARMASREVDEPGAFWSNDGFFRLGNFGPKSGVSLYVRTVSADEIRGMWTSHAGTAIIVDFTGDREPDEAGYFCARRVK